MHADFHQSKAMLMSSPLHPLPPPTSLQVTALTAQNTHGVHGVHASPLAFLEQQVDVIMSDIGADVVKARRDGGRGGGGRTLLEVRERGGGMRGSV